MVSNAPQLLLVPNPILAAWQMRGRNAADRLVELFLVWTSVDKPPSKVFYGGLEPRSRGVVLFFISAALVADDENIQRSHGFVLDYCCFLSVIPSSNEGLCHL